jgi:putative DNA primase/helicase
MTAAENLTARLGGRWHGSYGICRCPAHEDREPSLSVRDGERAPLLTCHAGCARNVVVDELRWRGLWRLSEPQRRSKPDIRPHRSEAETRRYALVIWRSCRPIAGTPAERYLRGRGIREIPPSLRYHPRLKHLETGLMLPAMVAAVQAPDRSIVAVHRTFLTADGSAKAPVSSPRKMLGRCAGCAVRLAAAGAELALGEGIETSLSFQQAAGIATWAVLSTSGMRSAILPPLPLAATVHILVDLDEAGERAAQIAADRLFGEGRLVKLDRPIAGKDCNDALREAVHAQ